MISIRDNITLITSIKNNTKSITSIRDKRRGFKKYTNGFIPHPKAYYDTEGNLYYPTDKLFMKFSKSQMDSDIYQLGDKVSIYENNSFVYYIGKYDANNTKDVFIVQSIDNTQLYSVLFIKSKEEDKPDTIIEIDFKQYKNFMTDFVIKCNNGEVKCHKFVLIKNCELFRSLYKDKQLTDTFTMLDNSKEVVQFIIDIFYDGTDISLLINDPHFLEIIDILFYFGNKEITEKIVTNHKLILLEHKKICVRKYEAFSFIIQ